jgi:hypothetical protein
MIEARIEHEESRQWNYGGVRSRRGKTIEPFFCKPSSGAMPLFLIRKDACTVE